MSKTKVTTNEISINAQPVTHCIENFYYNTCNNRIYILCQVDHDKVCLIGLTTGNRYSDPVNVYNVHCISDYEFRTVCAEQYDDFKLLSSVDITASI